MSVAVSRSSSRASHVFLAAVLSLLGAAILWFMSQKLHYFTDYSQTSFGDYFWGRRAGLLMHVSGGVAAICVGLVQLWLGLTHRVGAWHRTLGKVYGAGILIGSFGGFYLALNIPGHLAYSTGLLMLCVAWLLTTGMAVYAIKTRHIEQHREWMLRSYTVTFAFVTFRLATSWLGRWISVPDDPVAGELDTLMAWACWAVPLLIAEPLIQWRAMHRTRGRRARVQD